MAYYQQPLDVTTLPAWQALLKHRQDMQGFSMREAFADDAKRFERFSMSTSGIFLDYSKNLLSTQTRDLLVNLAEEMELPVAIESMFRGEKINVTEDRAVLHTALRNFTDAELLLDGEDILKDVRDVQQQMKTFCDNILPLK